jgi:hypothetical protein
MHLMLVLYPVALVAATVTSQSWCQRLLLSFDFDFDEMR